MTNPTPTEGADNKKTGPSTLTWIFGIVAVLIASGIIIYILAILYPQSVDDRELRRSSLIERVVINNILPLDNGDNPLYATYARVQVDDVSTFPITGTFIVVLPEYAEVHSIQKGDDLCSFTLDTTINAVRQTVSWTECAILETFMFFPRDIEVYFGSPPER